MRVESTVKIHTIRILYRNNIKIHLTNYLKQIIMKILSPKHIYSCIKTHIYTVYISYGTYRFT